MKREAKRNANRRKLIDAAIASIAELGLAGTTVSSVVARAGLSRGIINLHFETKEALLAEVLRALTLEWRGAWRETLVVETSPAERLRDMLLIAFEPPVFDRRKLAAWHAFYADSKQQDTYRAVAGENDRAYLDTLTELCRQVIDQGGYRDVDPWLTAMGLQSMTDGLCLNWLTNPRETTPEVARRVCQQALKTAFPDHFPVPEPASKAASAA
jgi:TetR/AcrR family transcriptional repressor of bet genes